MAKKIISKRGRPIEEVPPSDIDEIELNLVDLDDEEDTANPQTEFDWYKENWIIQHRAKLHFVGAAFEPKLGRMIENPIDRSVRIYTGVGDHWLTFSLLSLHKLLSVSAD